jgi:hypothetical protein
MRIERSGNAWRPAHATMGESERLAVRDPFVPTSNRTPWPVEGVLFLGSRSAIKPALPVCYLGRMGREIRSKLCLDCGVRMKLVRELSWLGPALPAVQLFQCGQCGRADTVDLPGPEAPTPEA